MIRRAFGTALALAAVGVLSERLGRWLRERHGA